MATVGEWQSCVNAFLAAGNSPTVVAATLQVVDACAQQNQQGLVGAFQKVYVDPEVNYYGAVDDLLITMHVYVL